MSGMRPFMELIGFEEARALLLENARLVERTETVPLTEAHGRVLASDIAATRDVPGFRRAAMDGYAVRAEDTFGASRVSPKTLECMGAIYTGQVSGGRVQAGQCVQIATGAPMPPGADAVVMVEETSADGDRVKIFKPVYPGANMSRADADIARGDLLLARGTVLDPPAIGVIASQGMDTVKVLARPIAGIFPTGQEIASPGTGLAEGMVYDINTYTLASLLESAGAGVKIHAIAPDTREALADSIRTAVETGCDIAVFSGGSSVGERDLLAGVVEDMGRLIFHGIALKPGKPTLLGMVDGTMVMGLPGYPTSCLTNAYALLLPAVRKMASLPHNPVQVRAALAEKIVSTIGRHHLYTVRLEGGLAYPAFKESGAITSMSRASGWIDIPQNTEFLEKGTEVTVTLF